MKYNFDQPVRRRGTNCVKWDEMPSEDIIPMWVADMDFETAPCIVNALRDRLQHGCFGYTKVPESYYESVISWFKRRHGWEISRDSFIYTTGVVPAISAIIKAMTSEGDKVLVQTPVYNCFFSSIRNNGCTIEKSPLTLSDGVYTVDWEDFETRCSDPAVKVFLLCNPHNPAGRVWTLEELRRMGEICRKHNVFVISDEIHCEIAMPGNRDEKTASEYGETAIKYHPYAAISPDFASNCAVCVSPSKAFNIAGLQIANIIINDETIRQKVDKAININEVCDVNPFGVIALQAAYNEGEDWLAELNAYIYENYKFAKEYLQNALPDITVVTLEGTYLMWADISSYGLTSSELTAKLLNEGKVFVNDGEMYGDNRFIRINLATRRELVAEGVRRIADVISTLKK